VPGRKYNESDSWKRPIPRSIGKMHVRGAIYFYNGGRFL
jgi:hypothetical protein